MVVNRRANGEPIAYIRGHVEWYDLDLVVTPRVLVPRPETELLLETAVEVGKSIAAGIVADVGTGSGAIAIGIARALPFARVIGIDIDEGALAVARLNVHRLGLDSRVTTLQGYLLQPLDAKPDLVVANLPYLSDDMMGALDRSVAHEPELALRGGRTGLEVYAELFLQLRSRGWDRVPVVLEIDSRQSAQLRDLAQFHRPEAKLTITPDLAGLDRVAVLWPACGELA